jgi:hypothetical protein
MTAKNKVMIINSMEKSSLQVSLQKEQLRKTLQRRFCLPPSLQFQLVPQLVCKEKSIDYQNIYANLDCITLCRDQILTGA